MYQNVDWNEIIPYIEERVQENPFANDGNAFLKDVLPFIRAVHPRVARRRSLFGDMTLISLDDSFANGVSLVEEGLQPLEKVLTAAQKARFRQWLLAPTDETPSATFTLEGIAYTLKADHYQGCRDLLLFAHSEGKEKEEYPFYCLKVGCSSFGKDGLCYNSDACTWVPNQPNPR